MLSIWSFVQESVILNPKRMGFNSVPNAFTSVAVLGIQRDIRLLG